MSSVLDAFGSHKLNKLPSATAVYGGISTWFMAYKSTDRGEDVYFPKYLTGPNLLHLQVNDAAFRKQASYTMRYYTILIRSGFGSDVDCTAIFEGGREIQEVCLTNHIHPCIYTYTLGMIRN